MTAKPPEGPARLRPEHRQDRILSIAAGAPRGYRSLSWPIQIAHEQKRIGAAQFEAIKHYDELIETAEIRSRRDSTELDIVSGGGSYPVSDAKGAAIRQLIAIDSRLSDKDRRIARDLCAGFGLHEAITKNFGGAYKFAVTARVCEALDALSQAIIAAKKSKFTFYSKPIE